MRDPSPGSLGHHVPELNPRTWRGLALLTLTLTRRFLREGLVMRSLVWPTGITVGTLVATLVVAAILKGSVVVGITDQVPAEVVQVIEAQGWATRTTDDPVGLVRRGSAWAATDGRALWAANPSVDLLHLEAMLRAHHGADWTPAVHQASSTPQAPPEHSGDPGLLICRMLAVLFALYGVVFGLGAVARDRDDGTLEAELSLPLPHWVPGLARWIAATAVLTGSYALAVVLFDAIMGVTEPATIVRHGFAACGGAAAIGLMAVGGAGLKQGFSGPLAAGLTLTTAAIGFGLGAPSIGHVLPLASLFAGGSGWGPVGATLALGLLSAGVFSVRSART